MLLSCLKTFSGPWLSSKWRTHSSPWYPTPLGRLCSPRPAVSVFSPLCSQRSALHLSWKFPKFPQIVCSLELPYLCTFSSYSFLGDCPWPLPKPTLLGTAFHMLPPLPPLLILTVELTTVDIFFLPLICKLLESKARLFHTCISSAWIFLTV